MLLCDPDSWNPQILDYEWGRDWGAWQVLMGYAITVGVQLETVEMEDRRMDGYRGKPMTPDRDLLIKRLLPPLASPGRPRDIWEREDNPSVIENQLAAGAERWHMVALTNYRPVLKHVRLNLDRLWDESAFDSQGFCGDLAKLGTTHRHYLVYDFWPKKFVGETGGAVEFDLEAMRGKVLAVRKALGRPQLLAVGDHIGQGIEELKESAWDDPTKTLSLTTQGRRAIQHRRAIARAGWMDCVSLSAGKTKLPHSFPEPEVLLFTVPDQKSAVTCKVEFAGPNGTAKPAARPIDPGLVAALTTRPEAGRKVRGGAAGALETPIGRASEQGPALRLRTGLLCRTFGRPHRRADHRRL